MWNRDFYADDAASDLDVVRDTLERHVPQEVQFRLRAIGDGDLFVGLMDALAEEELEQEMVSYDKTDTGIANIVFVSARGKTRHGPRIKVAINPPDSFSPHGEIAVVDFDGKLIEGDMPTDLLRQVQRFIEINRDVLTEYWNYQILTKELSRRLRSI